MRLETRPTVRIDAIDDPVLEPYRAVGDGDLLHRRGLFVAEGRLIVRRLLASPRYHVRSLLVTPAALHSLADVLADPAHPLPVYVVTPALMRDLTGFNFHRGCLALGERPAEIDVADMLPWAAGRAPLVVLERVGNADNVGGVFRNAAAFGAAAVILSPGCCDPLYRKALRVSMGGSLRVPFVQLAPWPERLAQLKARGVLLVALTLEAEAMDLDHLPAALGGRRAALILGSEGQGISAEVTQGADIRVKIRIEPGVDSLNLATASGIALHRLAGIK